MKNSPIVLSLILCLLFFTSAAQNDTLKIGIKEAPPFVMLQGSIPGGLSLEFWELTNSNMDYAYEYVPFQDIGSLLEAVQNNEVDFSINPVTVSEKRIEAMDFSQPYFISQTTFVKRDESGILGFIYSLFSWEFFSAVAVLLFIIFVFGMLVWLFERRSKNDQFKKSIHGIADGFWWSAVTMTTVGYGDKAPSSSGGRVVAFIWMFTSIILISGLTAGIASALTVKSINAQVESLSDLSRFKTVTVANSSSSEFLNHYQVKHITTPSLQEGIMDVVEGRADVLVYDRPILNFEIWELGVQEDLVVSEKGFKTDYYSFTFPKHSPIFDEINRNLVSKFKSREWDRMKEGVE